MAASQFDRFGETSRFKPKGSDMRLTRYALAQHAFAADLAEFAHGRFAAMIDLPQRLAPAPDKTARAPFHEGRQIAAMGGLRILIVEDDVTVGPLLAEMLEDLGHVVCGVEVVLANAVAASTRCHPDLMIVDVGLGEVRGNAAIREILGDGSVPCVFVTDDALRALSRVPGAVLVRKPFRAPDIVAAIQRAIGART